MSPTITHSNAASTNAAIEYNYGDEKQSQSNRALLSEQRRSDWIKKSVQYYSKVARLKDEDVPEYIYTKKNLYR